MSKSSIPLSFSTQKYPKFGRGTYSDQRAPVTVTSSPFFWWFRFLQLNEEYDLAIHGKRTSIPSDVTSALGAVRDTDFKTWWRSHNHLFAEPSTQYRLIEVTETGQLAPIGSADAVNVIVPLGWSSRAIRKSFNRLLKTWVEQGRVVATNQGFSKSSAEFQIGRKWHISAMKSAYDVYTVKQQAIEAGERLTWADAAIRARIPNAIGMTERDLSYKHKHQRMVLSILAQRHYARAVKFIAASATRRFPD